MCVWQIYLHIFIDENVFKTTRSFLYQWFRVFILQANANKPFSFKHKTHYWRRQCNFKMATASSPVLCWKRNGLLEFAWRVETRNHWQQNDRVVLKTLSSLSIYLYIYMLICERYMLYLILPVAPSRNRRWVPKLKEGLLFEAITVLQIVCIGLIIKEQTAFCII